MNHERIKAQVQLSCFLATTPSPSFKPASVFSLIAKNQDTLHDTVRNVEEMKDK
jgi:hypothetical protein